MFSKFAWMALVPVAASVFLLSPAFAETSVSGTTRMRPEKLMPDLTCMQNAVVARDNSVESGLTTFYNSVKTALETRRDALKSAWTMADKDARRAAQRAAWEAFNNNAKSARRAFKDAKHQAWKKFADDRRSCHSQGEDTSHEGQDERL